MKTLYFVDYLTTTIPPEVMVISLSPRASAALEKEGISYQIPEDFYALNVRNDQSEHYRRNFSQWIDQSDGFIHHHLHDALLKDVKFFRLSGYYLKNWIDHYVMTAQNLLAVIKKCAPQKIVYLGKKKEKADFTILSFFDKRDNCDKVLALICAQSRIVYEEALVLPQNKKDFGKETKGLSDVIKIIGKICRYLLTAGQILIGIILNSVGEYKSFVIFCEGWINNFCMQARIKGHKVLWATPQGMKTILFGQKSPFATPKTTEDKTLLANWAQIETLCLENLPFWGWLRKQVDVDLSPIFKEGFSFLFHYVFPNIHHSFNQYRSLFEQNKPDALLMPYKVSPFELGVVASACVSGVKVIQVEHGHSEFYDHRWEYTEFPCDFYLTTSPRDQEFFKDFFKELGGTQTRVACANIWIRRHIAENQRRKCLSPRDPKTIVYIPSFQDILLWRCSYPVAWYFEFLKNMVIFFGQRKDFQFIIKSHPHMANLMDPLRQWLSKRNLDNVTVVETPLLKALRAADAVITDYPSTPTFEARVIGLPVVSFCHSSLMMIPQTQRYYRQTIQMFDSWKDIPPALENFLKNVNSYAFPTEDLTNQPSLYACVMDYCHDVHEILLAQTASKLAEGIVNP